MDTPDEHLAVPVGEGPTAAFGGAEIAGRTVHGQGGGELLVRGDRAMLVRLRVAGGFDQDGHSHPDHESVGYVVSGRVEMTVGETTRVLGPGSTWYHPRGVRHTCRALEDAEMLEFHTPLRADVLALFGQAGQSR